MDQCLNESDNRKAEIEDLKLVLGPEDSEVDLICILMNMVCGEVKRGAFGPRGKDADLLICDMGSIAQKPSRRHFLVEVEHVKNARERSVQYV